MEVARVTTGEIPTVTPTMIEEARETISGVNGPPAIFGSTSRELLVIGICTWAPAAQVDPLFTLSNSRLQVSGQCWWVWISLQPIWE